MVVADGKLLVRTVVDQTDHELVIREKDRLTDADATRDRLVQVAFAGDLFHPLVAHADVFVPGPSERLPHPSLTQTGGGPNAPDPSDPKGEKTTIKQFQVYVTVDNADGKFYPGQRAYVRFQLDRQPLMNTWVRRLWQMLQSHENDSKLT